MKRPVVDLGDWPLPVTNTSSSSTALGPTSTPVYTDEHNPQTCAFCRCQNDPDLAPPAEPRYFRAASKPGERVRFEECAPPAEPTIAELLESCGELEHDPVENPAHYTEGFRGVEVIQITEHLNFCRGNVVKYVCRAGKKGGPEQEVEDLKKAIWYLNRELFRLEGSC